MSKDYKRWRDSVGSGWGPLMDKLVEDITKLGWDGQIAQVKEKFGGLRFYVGHASDAIFERIAKAEKASYEICEECGMSGVLRRGGWLKTLCEEHAGGREPWSFKEDVP